MSGPETPSGPPAGRGVLPRIAKPSAGLSTMGIAIAAIVAGSLLFTVLEARRSDLGAPAVRPARADLLATSAAPPPLYIPPQLPPPSIGIAPCRDRGGQYAYNSGSGES